jgi:hypothetical protein
VQYLALIYTDERAWNDQDDVQRAASTERYMAFAAKGRQAGVVVGGERLADSTDATTVRIREHQTVVVDGPYAEVKEALGGYFLLECDSIDEACEWAAEIPGASWGSVEVRPVHRDPEEEHL